MWLQWCIYTCKWNCNIQNTGGSAAPNNRKNIIIKKCAPFSDCMSEINNTQIDNAKYIDIVMSMYNLKEYSDNYSKTSGSLWQNYRDEPLLNNHGDIADFPTDINNSVSFEFKRKIAARVGNNGSKDFKIRVTIKIFK